MSMNSQEYIVRDATLNEFLEIGKLMVNVYSQLEGFPTKMNNLIIIKCLPILEV